MDAVLTNQTVRDVYLGKRQREMPPGETYSGMLPGDMLPGDMLKVSGLRAGYGRIPILGGVTLSVQRGEFVGMLGHNGMGKTTLLKALMGIFLPTAGQIRVARSRHHPATPSARAQRRPRLCAAGTRDLPGAERARESAHGLPAVAIATSAAPSTGVGRISPPDASCSTGRAARCPAASNNCWRWHAACAAVRASSCWTSRPRASSLRSSKKSSTPCNRCGHRTTLP